MAQEIMIVTPAISNLIREGKTAQMYGFIQTGGKESMQTLESILAKLYLDGDITFEAAVSKTSRPEELLRIVRPNPAPVAKRKAGTFNPKDEIRSRSISG
jgi:twitching motility protein PilT